MPISDSLKLIFIHIPKNAGTAIEASVGMRATGHKSWKTYAALFPHEWASYRSFAVIREPISRFISCYRYARMPRSYWHTSVEGETAVYGKHPDYEAACRYDFDDFLAHCSSGTINLHHPGWIPQARWICDGAKVMVDELVRFEDIDSGLERLGFHAIPRLNASAGSEAFSLTATQKKAIAAMYAEDYEIFGF